MDNLIEQLDSLLQKYSELLQKSKHNDLSDLSKVERQSIVTRGIAAICRISGNDSVYVREINRILNGTPELHLHTSRVIGIVQALKEDLSAGYVKTLIELIHENLFSDFLDMSYHLLESGYKDAAAVIAGSTLESHIKELCKKNSIDLETEGRPIKADRLNAALTKADVYSKLDQKNVTAWLDLRNKAAHGNYEEYTKEQVELLLASVRGFVGRVPA